MIWNERARPSCAAAIGRQRGDVAAVETDAAGVGRDLAGELADQRGLAGAVRPDDGVQLARRHVERDVVGGDDAAEALAQAVDLAAAASATARPREQAVDAAAREQHDQQEASARG